jgi:hypothetical protein
MLKFVLVGSIPSRGVMTDHAVITYAAPARSI